MRDVAPPGNVEDGAPATAEQAVYSPFQSAPDL